MEKCIGPPRHYTYSSLLASQSELVPLLHMFQVDSSMMAFYKILDYVCGNLPIHPGDCEWHWCWPGGTDTNLCLSSHQGYLMGLSQSSELANQHYSIPKWKNLTGWLQSVYKVLCARENSHAGTGKGLPQTVP